MIGFRLELTGVDSVDTLGGHKLRRMDVEWVGLGWLGADRAEINILVL